MKTLEKNVSIFLILFVSIFIFISCGENKELVRQNQIAYEKKEKQRQLEEQKKTEKIQEAKVF